MSNIQNPPLYALLVGINEYKNPQITPLRGCVPDVEAVERFLVGQLDVPTRQITMLRNGEATYAAVIAAFESLRKQAPKEAQVLVYFSCHGSQAPAVDPTIEADGLDETLVLHDSRTEGVYDLLDKELGYLLDQLVQKELYVTVVLDSCHSGSGTRAPEERVRLTMRDARTRPLELVYGGAQALALAKTRQLGGDWVNPGTGEASYVLLAGCRDEQRSREMEFDGQPRGLMSYYLLDELSKRLRPTTTYADLHQTLLARVRERVRDQEPQAEGAVNRLVFEEVYLRRLPPVALKKVDLDTATIDMGAAQGLSEGSTLLAFASAEDMAEATKALARLTVFRVGTSESFATFDLLNGSDLPITALLQVERYAYTPARRVLLDGPGLEAARDAISTGGPGNSPTPFVEVVERQEEAQLLVRRQGDTMQVLDSQGVPLIAELTVKPHNETRLAELLLKRLEHLARYWFAYDLRPKPAEDRLAGLVRLELCRVVQPGNPPTVETLTGDDVVVRTGDALAIRMTNLGQEPLYVSLWNFTADWAVLPVFPANGGTEKLEPGKWTPYPIGIQENPPGGRSETVELLKLFVTKEPTNAFQVLAQDELELSRRSSRGATDDSPLGLFLAELTQGKRAIGGGKMAQWSAVDLTVRALADPKALPVQPGKSVSLPDGVTLHGNGRFSGRLRLATRNQATRGTGAAASLRPPPAFAAAPDTFEPVALAATRGDASPALILSLDGDAAAFQSVSSAAPLTLELPAALVGNDARLLAVAYDGANYVLVGGPRANANGSSVTIEYLPIPQDSADSEEVKQRGLAHTVRLMFFKVTGQGLPDV
ncbi:MAG: caspase family protein, partial [Chloroflexaceae bacterium]|nr:caspase family protein [Chloroflexaceae bacterium]